MGKNQTKPGAYIWFDKWNPLTKRLSYEQKGMLIDALIQYCQFGKKAFFESDPLLDTAFEMLADSAEADDKSYAEAVAKKKLSGHYSRFISKASPEDYIGYEEWLEMNPDLKREATEYGESKRTIRSQQNQHVLTDANTCQPTTTPTTTSTTTPKPITTTDTTTETTPETTPEAKATAENDKDDTLGKIEDKGGVGEKGESEPQIQEVKKQPLYVEPDDGESEEDFQERRKREMIAQLMGSMTEEQISEHERTMLNKTKILELPSIRCVV